jgi:hypothetical protein
MFLQVVNEHQNKENRKYAEEKNLCPMKRLLHFFKVPFAVKQLYAVGF